MKATFTIPALDCPSEEALIRRTLGTRPGVRELHFDLVACTVTIHHDGLDREELHRLLSSVGMRPSDRPLDAPGSACCSAVGSGGQQAPSRWRAQGSFLLAGALALLCEGLYFAGLPETSWPVVALALLSMLLAGRTTFFKGWIALRTFTLNIHFLMCLAVVGGAVIGAWPEMAMVVFFFELAERIESRALDRARHAVRSLMALAPQIARVEQADGSWQEVPVEQVAPGSRVLVRPGERLPLDGVVVEGISSVDQAPVTGESVPVDKEVGDTVFAGTINTVGVLVFQTTGSRDQTTLARIIRTVQEAQSSRAPMQRFVDAFARIYTPVVCLIAVLVTVLPWLIFGQPFWAWFYKALVLLVIACPCALVISTPVTVVSGLTAAARRGLLIKGGVYLEKGRHLRVIALDKTGTITEGRPRVTDVRPLDEVSQDGLLQWAASLDALSSHPIAQAVAGAWEGPLKPVTAFAALPGRGVQGQIEGVPVLVGNLRFMKEQGLSTPALEGVLERFEAQGKTAAIVAAGSRVLGVIALADRPRETSVQALGELHQLGVQTLLLSGDNRVTAEAVAQAVGVDQVCGELLPEDKLMEIQRLVSEHGAVVGMVGDGVNDAPALARATIGFAMGAAGTDTAIEAADVALMRDDLRGLPQFIRLSRYTAAVLTQNIVLAIGLKVVFFVLALLGLATMWMAIIADVGATLLVVANGLRVLRFRDVA